MVISSLLFPSRKISKPLLTSLKICFARLCDSLFITASVDLILCFQCGHAQTQLMWVVFFLETKAKKHSMFIPHGPIPCLPLGHSQKKRATVHTSVLLGFFAAEKAFLNKFTNEKKVFQKQQNLKWI